jgi:hypothetical protein
LRGETFFEIGQLSIKKITIMLISKSKRSKMTKTTQKSSNKKFVLEKDFLVFTWAKNYIIFTFVEIFLVARKGDFFGTPATHYPTQNSSNCKIIPFLNLTYVENFHVCLEKPF